MGRDVFNNINIIMLKSFIKVGQCGVSRHKTLLKRRKIKTKKRDISTKKLADQLKHYKYAHQYKAYQIQRELDRKTHPSHHLNELMDQIFYPDITKHNQTAAHIAFQSIHQQQATLHTYEDQLDQLLDQQVLPANILQNVFAQFHSQFQPKHYELMLKKLDQYLRNRQKVKTNLQNSWKKMNQSLKKKDSKYQIRKCPYLFLQAHDFQHYEPWQNFITHFAKIVQNCDNHEEFGLYVRLILKINSMIEGIPYQLFQNFVKILSHFQFITQLNKTDKVNCLHLFSFRNNILYPSYTTIDPQKPDSYGIQRVKRNCLKLCFQILYDPSCDSYDLTKVFRCFRYRILHFNQSVQKAIKTPIISFLSETPVEKVIDYFKLYLKVPIYICNKQDQQIDEKEDDYGLETEEQQKAFLQLLKFDIIRKIPLAVSKSHLMNCLNLVENEKLTFQVCEISGKSIKNIQIDGIDLFSFTLNSICSRYCGTQALTYNEILKIVDCCLRNNYGQKNSLELLMGEVLRHKDQYTLGELVHVIFKIKMLGYESVASANVLLNQLQNRYHTEKQHLKDNRKLMLTDNNEQNPDMRTNEGLGAQQMMLQEDLVLGIWTSVHTMWQVSNANKLLKPTIDINRMLRIYPISIESSSNFIKTLTIQIYQILKPLSSFWLIKTNPTTNLNQNYQIRFLEYYRWARKDPIFRLMEQEAEQSKQFINGCHRFHKMYLPAPWVSFKTFSIPSYLNWLKTCPHVLYFDQEKQASHQMVAKRTQLLNSIHID